MRVYERQLCGDCGDPRIMISMTLDEAALFLPAIRPSNTISIRVSERLGAVLASLASKTATPKS